MKIKNYQLIDGMHVLPEERNILGYIAPSRERTKLEDNNDAFLLAVLQNELHGMLNSYLNGGFTKVGYVLFPLYYPLSPELKQKMLFAKKVASELQKRGYGFGIYSQASFSESIASLYRDLGKNLPKAKKITFKKPCPDFSKDNIQKKNHDQYVPLLKFKEYALHYFEKDLFGLYLHGSFATQDFISGYSDVDTVAILKDEALLSPETLQELRKNVYRARKYFYEVDPLQHHGISFMTETDSRWYPQAYFPLTLFSYSRSFFVSDKKMQFNERSYGQESVMQFFWFVNYFRKLNLQKGRRFSPYDLKTLLHSAALIPALYLQAKGKPIYKKFSFNEAAKDFTKKEWKPINTMTSIRNEWKAINYSGVIKSLCAHNPLLGAQINARIQGLFGDKNRKAEAKTEELIEGMHLLSEHMWQRIKHEHDL